MGIKEASFRRSEIKKPGSRQASVDAEREGFEPPERCRSTVFKTAVIDHSTTSPVFSAVWRQNRLFHEMECKDSKNLIPVKKKDEFFNIPAGYILQDRLRTRQGRLYS